MTGLQPLAKQDNPGAVVGVGRGQQGFVGELPAGAQLRAPDQSCRERGSWDNNIRETPSLEIMGFIMRAQSSVLLLYRQAPRSRLRCGQTWKQTTLFPASRHQGTSQPRSSITRGPVLCVIFPSNVLSAWRRESCSVSGCWCCSSTCRREPGRPARGGTGQGTGAGRLCRPGHAPLDQGGQGERTGETGAGSGRRA